MPAKSSKRLPGILTALLLAFTVPAVPLVASARPLPVTLVMLAFQLQALGIIPRPDLLSKLTPQQRQRLETVSKDTKIKVEGVLTRAQRTQFAQDMRSGKKMTTIMQSLKLTPTQKARIQSIIQTSRQRVNHILAEKSPATPTNNAKR